MKLRKKTVLVLSIALMFSVVFAMPLVEAPIKRFYLVRVFPTEDDNWSIAMDPYWWHAGDYVEGKRDLGAAYTVVRVLIHLELDTNVLSGAGVVILEIYLNGVKIGQFRVYPGEFSKDISKGGFSIPCPTGIVKIRYHESNTVPPGLGSISINPNYSCVGFKVHT